MAFYVKSASAVQVDSLPRFSIHPQLNEIWILPQLNFWSQRTISILRTLQSSPWSSIHPQPGWGQNLPTVSHGTAGRLRGLGGICAFPSVAHSLLSKPLPLSAAICFQPYPTGRKHEHFHRRIWTSHKLKKKKKKGEEKRRGREEPMADLIDRCLSLKNMTR